jgi:exopolysaccharide biosynthesis polyprenyl glycosylphosphotransferase
MSDPKPRLARRRARAQDRHLRAAPSATISHSYGRRDYVLRRALALSDIGSLFLSLAIGIGAFNAGAHRAELLYIVPLIPAWLLLFRAYGLYERDIKRISHAALDDVPNIFHALMIGTLGIWVWLRVLPGAERLVLGEVIVFGAAALVLIPVARIVTRRLVERVMGPERVVFVGDPSALSGLVQKIWAHPEYSLEPVGVVPLAAGQTSASLPVLSPLGELDLTELEQRHAFERLIVAHDEVDDQALLDLLQECGRLSIKVSILPRFGDALGPSVEVDEIEGVTLLDLNPLVLPRSSRYFKRAMDITGASLALVLAAIPMVLIAVAVKLDSRGPVLFRQERIGRRERRFRLLKFRTMVPDAEERVEELQKHSTDPHWLKLDRDPRVTRVGRILRLSSLDELPQLINVLKGEMSLVGPRPLIASEDERVHGWSRTRLDLAPGITGLWQVLGRTTIPFDEMVKLDTLYVTNWSLWLDVKLIIRTFRIVANRRGAN